MVTLCLLHGAWHDPSCWDGVTRRLEERGHRAIAPDLPYHEIGSGFEERVRPALEVLGGVDGPLVVVGHSMASSYAPLIAAARPVSLLVYLCPAPVPIVSGGPERMRESFPFPIERPDGTTTWDPEEAIAAMYRRVPADTARVLAARLRPMAPAAGPYPLSAHPHVSTVLVYATEDELFEPTFEEFLARELDAERIGIPGGHFPMAEDPDALAELLDRLARRSSSPRDG